jgi:hypothetical protein
MEVPQREERARPQRVDGAAVQARLWSGQTDGAGEAKQEKEETTVVPHLEVLKTKLGF